jgi:predicted MFS family arabinose efflux permease
LIPVLVQTRKLIWQKTIIMPPQVDMERNADELIEPLLGADEQVQAQEQAPRQEEVSTKSSRNVRYALIYTALAFAGRSVWSQSVLASYVYILKNDSPEAVGTITAVMGVAQLLASFPSGYLADSHRRDSLLKIASCVGVLAILSTLLALWHENFHYLMAALAVWGVSYGIGNTALTALFADSIRTGERSYYFTLRSMLITLGNTGGPMVALILFADLGNEWTIKECVIVMMVGQAICLPAVLLLCLFSDDIAVDSSSTTADETGTTTVEQTSGLVDESVSRGLVDESDSPPDKARQLLLQESGVDTETSTGIDTDDDAANENSNEIFFGLLPKNRAIPILIASCDVISGLGSGMSIRFFPIFFVNNLKLSPVMVQVLYVVSPLLQASIMRKAQMIAKSYGRCHVAVAFKWVGLSFMLLMILAYVSNLPTWSVCLLYILRTAFMNATGGLTKSVLMDNVPQEERGKWSALESVNMFSWSGSAALGGVLVGTVGLIPLFLVTASVQWTATLALVALFGHDTIEVTDDDDDDDAESSFSEEDDEHGELSSASNPTAPRSSRAR